MGRGIRAVLFLSFFSTFLFDLKFYHSDVKPHEKVLTFKLFGLEAKKAKKDLLKLSNASFGPRDSKGSIAKPSAPGAKGIL